MTNALRRGLLALALSSLAAAQARAEDIQVAVAANFTEAAKKIAADFERDTGNAVRLSFGATGAFYAQIAAGAPFDVLLAADEATPKKLVDEGRGVAGRARPTRSAGSCCSRPTRRSSTPRAPSEVGQDPPRGRPPTRSSRRTASPRNRRCTSSAWRTR